MAFTRNRMAAVLAVVLAVLAGPTASAVPVPGPLGIPGRWRIVFSDDFNGPHLDHAKWTAGSHAPSGAVNCYSPDQVSVHDGALDLMLEQKTSTCAAGTMTRPYVSGTVSTAGHFAIAPGMAFEARINLTPTPAGEVANWPAFWATAWPDPGEIDIVEGLGIGAQNMCWSVHPEPTEPGGCTPPLTGWHTFGAHWETSGEVTFYYDGRNVGTSTATIPRIPEYLVLDNALATRNTRDGTRAVPAEMKIDYSRAWITT